MTGHVDPHLAVMLPVRVLGDGAASIAITATVDTGFTAYCTLPPRLVMLLNLPYYADIEAQMGDGRIVSLRVFRAGIQWQGARKAVLVYETDVPPLIGRSLLKGSFVSVEFIDGGRVSIDPLP